MDEVAFLRTLTLIPFWTGGPGLIQGRLKSEDWWRGVVQVLPNRVYHSGVLQTTGEMFTFKV
jgi:hypothetical protein